MKQIDEGGGKKKKSYSVRRAGHKWRIAWNRFYVCLPTDRNRLRFPTSKLTSVPIGPFLFQPIYFLCPPFPLFFSESSWVCLCHVTSSFVNLAQCTLLRYVPFRHFVKSRRFACGSHCLILDYVAGQASVVFCSALCSTSPHISKVLYAGRKS